MEKLGCLIGIITACFVTILVLTTDVGNFDHTVTISSQQTSFSGGNNTEISSTDVKLSNKASNIENKSLNAKNKGLNLDIGQINSSNENASFHFYNTNGSITRKDINNLKVGLKSEKTLSPMNHFTSNNHVKVYNQQNKFSNSPNNIYVQPHKVSNFGKRVNNLIPTQESASFYDEPYEVREQSHYAYKTLDWSTWRSNFINKITDDSVYIDSLNNYPQGSMFSYSFMVDNTGKIYDINVRSFQLSKEDKNKVAQLIKSYENTYITKFPPNSKRKMVRVSAILLFADKTEYSRPSDFHDLEQVRTKF